MSYLTQSDDFSEYLQAILEVEEVRLKNPKLDSIDLTTLEISCRLNYATVKAKQSEWDISMEQALKVRVLSFVVY